MSWQYCNDNKTVIRVNSDGSVESRFADSEDIVTWVAQGNTPTPDPEWTLPKVKARKVAQINAECTGRIYAKWPPGLQCSINAGLYPALVNQYTTDVAAMIDASNALGRDVVNACAAIDGVQAVTVAWPVI